MSDSFRNFVRKKKVKWPTERGYSSKKWNNLWKQSTGNSDEDEGLFLAGDIFSKILSELRDEIEAIYSRAPKVKKCQLLQAYCGMSNRDRFIISRQIKPTKEIKDLNAVRYSQNKFGNELSLQEIADGCVDSIAKAISSWTDRSEEISVGEDPIDHLEFISREVDISQLYGMYESYWQALVWGEYLFSTIDEKNKIYSVAQMKVPSEVAHEITQRRKLKLMGQASHIAADRRFQNFFEDDNYIYQR